MLSRQFRLVKDQDFARTVQKGRAFKLAGITVKMLVNGLSYNRYGIVVSNKVSKKAADRNQLKRRLREIIRSLQPQAASGFDLVVIAYKPLLERTFAELEQGLKQIFFKLRLIKND